MKDSQKAAEAAIFDQTDILPKKQLLVVLARWPYRFLYVLSTKMELVRSTPGAESPINKTPRRVVY